MFQEQLQVYVKLEVEALKNSSLWFSHVAYHKDAVYLSKFHEQKHLDLKKTK